MSALAQLMTVRYVRNANRATPTGDPSFVVQQSMPGPVSEEEADPFLMCDEFGPTVSQGAHGTDSDSGFTVPWHPHHGMEILSYMISGRGRHADSLGNREVFRSPGFQWLSVGSGIEHAEGGASAVASGPGPEASQLVTRASLRTRARPGGSIRVKSGQKFTRTNSWVKGHLTSTFRPGSIVCN